MINIDLYSEDDLYDLFRILLVAKFDSGHSGDICESTLVNNILEQIRQYPFEDNDLGEKIECYFITPWRLEDGIPYRKIEHLKYSEPDLNGAQLNARIRKVTFPYLLNDKLKAVLSEEKS